MARAEAGCLALSALLLTCEPDDGSSSADGDAAAPNRATGAELGAPTPRARLVHAPDADEAFSESSAPTASDLPAPCPEDMVWVHGDYCPVVEQKCLEHHPEYLARRHDPTVSERCLRYAEPSRCRADHERLSFCMDRFEYPNTAGALPRVLTSWTEAGRRCAEIGKRLCDEDEFNFACEGPEMLPYATGASRDPDACNIDRPYRQPNHRRRMKTYDECPAEAWCAEELARLDQRHRIGERLTCVSWAGVVDLNGNVNEWVVRPGQVSPHRSGLKGGWWGPVRNRCRPTVGFHKEHDYGYEAGFRCCKDAESGE